MFQDLSSQNRRDLFDTWLSGNNINSPAYRSNVNTVSRWLASHQLGDLPVVDIYGCPSPKTLLNIVARLFNQEAFINHQKDHNRNYSTPLRRYLEWVYNYISENNEKELEREFQEELNNHPVLLHGNYRIDLPQHQYILNSYNEEPKETDTLNAQQEQPRNRILFGAPGTGKSYHLKKQTEDLPQNRVERVTFHPEYTYFDFVGSYKPVMVKKNEDELIAYRFEAGPFAKMLKQALLHKDDEYYYLIIEEINRARAAAVFGDLFQLLDRDSEGRSEYGITPSRDLANYLTEKNEDGDGVNLENGKLHLPKNFFIWATMNSADQGVFPLDTAFKRRWSFEYIPIDHNENKISGTYGARWNTIRKHVNVLLQRAGINEDKQLGAFFLKGEELANEQRFQNAIEEKVIMYLYEDAARHQRRDIFKDDKARFSDLCKQFDGTAGSIFKEIAEQ